MSQINNQPSITVFDSPLSKVRYLETILDGKDWRTQILFPSDDPNAYASLQETRKTLAARGYTLNENRTAEGHYTLDIHHYGSGTEISNLVKDKGLSHGLAYSIAHPNIPLHELMKTSRGVFNEIGNFFKNPASANGIIFVSAEVFLTAAGFGNKGASGVKESFMQRMRQPKNYLQSLAGALFLSQSIVYMLFAKDNEQQAVDKLNKKTDKLEEATNTQDLRIKFKPEEDGPKQDINGKFSRFLKNNPVQIGAIANDLGMVAYIGHAVFNRRFQRGQLKNIEGMSNIKSIEALAGNIAQARKGTTIFKNKATRQAAKAELDALKKNPEFGHADDLLGARDYIKKGFVRDVGGAVTSLVAWSLLLLPSKKKTEEEKQADKDAVEGKGFIGKIIQKFKDDPEIGTGLLALTSSSQRLAGSLSKRNFLQTIGESIYIPGDVLLMFTKNSEFGGSNRTNVEKLSKHIAEDLNSQAWLLGPDAQRTLARDTATFIRDRSIADMAVEQKKDEAPLTPKELAAQTLKLEQAVLRRVAYTQGERFDELLDSAASLINRFPEHAKPAAQKTILATLSAQPWLHASEAELQAGLSLATNARMAGKHPITHIKDISEELKELVKRAPEIKQSDFAIRLTEVISQVAANTHATTPRPQVQQAQLADERLVATALQHAVQA